MQEIRDYSMTGVVGGGGGKFFSGGINGGGLRMRRHQNNILNHHQSLKCPRCNSLNTKFCYYNNYNLSQPRHFCKNCRRYWTKGGVLRNVPVGGCRRKAKRSKSKQSTSSSSADKTVTQEKSSSSDSSSLTASNSTVAARPEVASSVIQNFPVSDMPNGIEWSTLIGQSSSDGGVFSEIGGFTETTTFRFGGNSVNQADHMKLESETIQFGDRTAQIVFNGRSPDPNMGLEQLDLTSTVDQAYWSQTQWTTDHN